MKRLFSLLTLAVMLLALAAPCYALAPVAPSECPSECPEEAVNELPISAEQQDSGRKKLRESGTGNAVMSCGGCEPAKTGALKSVLEVYPELAFGDLHELDKSLNTAETKKTPKWVYTIDKSGYGFFLRQQHYNNTCGPTCAQMCLKGIANIEVTEEAAAKAMGVTPSHKPKAKGTHMESFVKYVNSMQSKYKYTAMGTKQSLWTSEENQLASAIYKEISKGVPSAIIIKNAEKSKGWPYNQKKDLPHFIAIYGMLDDKSQYAVCDPGADYAGMSQFRSYAPKKTEMFNAFSKAGGFAG